MLKRLSIFLICISCVFTIAAQVAQKPPLTKLPSTELQLRIVRARIKIKEGNAELNDAMEESRKGLMPPEKGKIWTPQDDGQYGILWIQVDEPKPVTAANGNK